MMKTRCLISLTARNRAPHKAPRLLTRSRLRAQMPRMRRALVALMSAVLVLTALPLERRLSPTAQAQGPTVLLRTCDPNHPFAKGQIIQKCKLGGGAPEAELEEETINDLLKLYRLPWSDRGRLLGWERNLIRAGVQARLINIIKKSPAERTPREQIIYSELTGLVKKRRILAATKAQEEFNRWLNPDNCPYMPPPPFTRPTENCVLNPTVFLGGRTPPSFEEFQVYGAYLANAELNDHTNEAIIKKTALGVGLLAGMVGTGVAAAVGAAIGASAFGLAAGKTVFLTFASIIILSTKPILTGGVAGATAIAAPVAVVVFAVVVGVIRGIQVFELEQLPIKLQEAKTRAENETPDLAELITTEEGVGEVYAEFIQATLPDFPAASTDVPAQSPADTKFLYRDYASTTPPPVATPPCDTATPPGFSETASIEYQDWEGNLHTARLSGGWFVDRKGSEPERLTLSIQFINHEGRNRLASRSGGQFVISDMSDDNAPPQLTCELRYLNGNFVKAGARIPNLTPVITAIPVIRHQEPPAPEVEWDLLTGTNKPTSHNVSHIATITDNDPIELLNVAITSPLTSNGVTLSEFKVNPDGKVFARIQPSCSATDAEFTLKVTDTANVTTTETIHVSVTPNQAPALAYQSAYIVTEHSSQVITPTVFPSDDNSSWPTLEFPFRTRVLTFEEPVVTPQGIGPAFTGTARLQRDLNGNPTGAIELNNAGPLGAYEVSVKVRDDCGKATTAAFFLSVRCMTVSYIAENPTCFASPNGKITINASSAAGGLLYSINDGQSYQSSNVFTGLEAGDYFISVKDAAGCVAPRQKVTLTDPAIVTYSITHVNPTCRGASNGRIKIHSASGGTGALKYSIDAGKTYQDSGDFNGLPAGIYNVVVKDSAGCARFSPTMELTDPAEITFSATPVNPTSSGASNGQIVINASGGSGKYIYSINGGASYQSSNTFAGLAAGQYSVKVASGSYYISEGDNDYCFASAQQVTLTNPAPLIAQVSGGGLLCGGSTAAITVHLSGGTAPYTVRLSDGQTQTSSSPAVTFNVSPSAPTTYTATAFDMHGNPATVSGSATVTPDKIAPVITAPAPIIVNGNSPGGATVSFSVTATDNCGAQPTLSFTKPSGSVFPFGATVVTVTATDRNGNSSQASFTVTVRTLQEQASLIMTQVEALISAGALNAGQGAGLNNKLAEVINKLDRGQTNAACNQLNSFINQANGLPKLTTAQRQSLITAANALRTNIGC